MDESHIIMNGCTTTCIIEDQDVGKMLIKLEVKSTIWAKGSIPYGGVIAFEHHGSSLQSSFWCL
jgi:hypothetical protein